ncbi:unnamed protein product [Cylicostephanus goldi]|uniref:Helicase ATP-binding domain-containing protein n=1 Tax=Cylicostephanus goldi TaxID=71465 RepID=A0A3P7QI82_CYLGO|nr:unnamed protein product [Cylicostephanus goldi]
MGSSRSSFNDFCSCDSSASTKILTHPSEAYHEAELERAGFDPLEGSSLRYPANEYLRQYEMDIVKSCVAVNSTVSLPLAVWFPRSRAIYCCNSLEAAEVFRERGAAVGIATEEISTIDTFQSFKKLPTHKVGRVIVTTPQTLEKIVESDSTVVEDIRCVVFCLEASENLRFTKYKNIVGVLTVKGILFRVLLVTPSVPSTSRKIGPLRKRQQLITSLLISQWIEPPATDPSFRNHSVPLGLSLEYCENVEVLSETRSFIEKWIEVVSEILAPKLSLELCFKILKEFISTYLLFELIKSVFCIKTGIFKKLS